MGKGDIWIGLRARLNENNRRKGYETERLRLVSRIFSVRAGRKQETTTVPKRSTYPVVRLRSHRHTKFLTGKPGLEDLGPIQGTYIYRKEPSGFKSKWEALRRVTTRPETRQINRAQQQFQTALIWAERPLMPASLHPTATDPNYFLNSTSNEK